MDWNYINTLLSVIHQASAAGPKFAPIVAKANDELFAYFAEPTAGVTDDSDEEAA